MDKILIDTNAKTTTRQFSDRGLMSNRETEAIKSNLVPIKTRGQKNRIKTRKEEEDKNALVIKQKKQLIEEQEQDWTSGESETEFNVPISSLKS